MYIFADRKRPLARSLYAAGGREEARKGLEWNAGRPRVSAGGLHGKRPPGREREREREYIQKSANGFLKRQQTAAADASSARSIYVAVFPQLAATVGCVDRRMNNIPTLNRLELCRNIYFSLFFAVWRPTIFPGRFFPSRPSISGPSGLRPLYRGQKLRGSAYVHALLYQRRAGTYTSVRGMRTRKCPPYTTTHTVRLRHFLPCKTHTRGLLPSLFMRLLHTVALFCQATS